MHKREFLRRYSFIGILFVLICAVFIIRLINLQITGMNYYKDTLDGISKREVEIKTQRGEIYDVNGKALVQNQYSYDLYFDASTFPRANAAANETVAAVCNILKESGFALKTTIPIRGIYPNVEYDDEAMKSDKIKRAFDRLLSDNLLDEDITALEFYEFLLGKYEILQKDGTYSYTGEEGRDLVAVRYDLDTLLFDTDNPYLILKNADVETITKAEERISRGVLIDRCFERSYVYPGYASHILGRVGRIQAGDEDYYLSLGYELDDLVGIDGVEKAFDATLRGKNGIMVIEEDAAGNVISSYVKEEPVPGKDVYLTIDIDLQIAAEKALAENVEKIIQDGINSGKENNGQDAKGGGICVLDTKTSAVRALASYPTYNLETFFEDYEILSQDERKPYLNRALQGALPPGSTFKIATAAAALTNGVITGSTVIKDTGKYTYYPDYQPSCWYTRGHGNLNAAGAIGVSCNYFFFDVGRQLGITALNDYCTGLGIGQPTGIELYESKGILAGPEYNDISGKGLWNPGDTLQAAIGQSDNTMTPAQLSSFISTILNNGVRNRVHILSKTCNYDGSDVQYYASEVLSTVQVSSETLAIIKQGMAQAKASTSTTKNYKFPIGIKTGTSQTSTQNNNAILTAFAPYDNPELTISCMIEDGAVGVNAAYSVLDIISHYYNLNKDGSVKAEEEPPASGSEAVTEPTENN